ncbi:hypothetical protein COLO4_35122 [Corchorus olitorius]|uniref:Uncharacterized protein n=1 Tax=Corchorus olitorius TaxID=93759 RepID=A0A1R3GIB5_9ROSI|nr:hypothetical protein COLO4_35122 [Corchorus olitorius]
MAESVKGMLILLGTGGESNSPPRRDGIRGMEVGDGTKYKSSSGIEI